MRNKSVPCNLGQASRAFYERTYLTRKFHPQILPNSNKFWMSMQCALFYICTLWCYWKNILLQNFLEVRKICRSKFPRKDKILGKRSWIQPLVFCSQYAVTSSGHPFKVAVLVLVNIVMLKYFCQVDLWGTHLYNGETRILPCYTI